MNYEDDEQLQRGFAKLRTEFQREMRPLIRKHDRRAFFASLLAALWCAGIGNWNLRFASSSTRPTVSRVLGVILLALAVPNAALAFRAFRRWKEL